ncbi:MAG: hypothetical protein ABSF50_12050 [Burkholderiaceae bacterium]|jgi:hypothetical protein
MTLAKSVERTSQGADFGRVRRLAGLGVIGVLTLAGCSRAVEGYCDWRLAAQHLDVTAASADPSVGQHYSARELDGLEGHAGAEITMGLTLAKPESAAAIELHGMRAPGGVCVRPNVHVRVGYGRIRVELANELPRDSCGYKEVLAHEMRHVAVYRSHLKRVEDEMGEALAKRLPEHKIYRFHSMEEAGHYFEDLQQDWLSPLSQELLASVTSEQAEIDSPEEYRRLSQACGKSLRAPP